MLISSSWSAGDAYSKVQKVSLNIMTRLEYFPGERKSHKYISLQGISNFIKSGEILFIFSKKTS